MGGNYVAEAGQVLHNPLHPEEAFATSIRFVAAHNRRPLVDGHCGRAGVRQQIDENVIGVEQKQVVSGLFDQHFPLLARGLAQGLNAFDSKRFDDGLHDR